MRARVGFLLTAVLLMPAAACSLLGIETVTGSGNPLTERYEVAGFKTVEVHGAFEVDITRGDQFDVAVTTDDNLMQFVTVTDDGPTLTVSVERGKNLRPQAGLTVAITMPKLEGVRLNGACTGSVKGFKGGEDLAVEVNGASKLKGDLDAGKVEIRANGASVVTLRGAARECDVDANGACQIHLGDLKLSRANVQLNGASSGTVHATENLDYDLNGASSLGYRGHPTVGKHEAHGASSAHEK